MPAIPASPSSRPGPSRLLKVSVTLVVIFGTVFILEMIFGQVRGSEFSPDRFERRTFAFYQIPGLGVQISPVFRDDVSNDLEAFLRRKGLIAAKPISKRWDVVFVASGMDTRSMEGQARILCRYLDQSDGQGDLWWLAWSRDHSALAAPLWSAIQQAADLEAYCLVPELFEMAIRAEDPTVFAGQLDRALYESYSALAEDYRALGEPATAQTYQAAAEARNPSRSARPPQPAVAR